MALMHIADNDNFVASQINQIMDYIQNVSREVGGGHTHTGSNDTGPQISHADLLDGVISGRTHSHTAIDAHMGATAGSGASGVHGLSAGILVPGVVSTQHVLQFGYTARTSGQVGVNCNTTLNTIVGVVITGRVSTPAGESASGPSYSVYSITNAAGASWFQARVDSYSDNVTGLYWLAWGTK